MSTEFIASNQIRCLKCKDEPFSAFRHDMKWCVCGAVAVDGGQAYLKRSGNPEDYEDMSIIVTQDQVYQLTMAVKWGHDNGRNEIGIALAVLRAVRDSGLLRDKSKVDKRLDVHLAEQVEDDFVEWQDTGGEG